MNPSDPTPKLPAWIFIATDLALIGAAVLIAVASPQPLSASAMLWIVVCVGLGAIAGLVPLVVMYERRKNEMLDDRQRELEALARTVSSSAEQISIAANGLHQISELALRNLRMAEHLPHKLQDKMAEFQAQLAVATDAEKEELERELLSLRTSESERLESISQRIAKTTAEWTKLEAATHQHLAAANDAATRIGAGLTGAIGQAQSAAEQALAQARIDAARAVGEASGQALRALEAAKAAAWAEFEAKVAHAAITVTERVSAELSARFASLPSHLSASASHPPVSESATEPPFAPGATAPGAEPSVAAPVTPSGQPPKRSRRARRDDNPPVAGLSAEEPQPVPADAIPEITPVAPSTAEPFSGHIASEPPIPPTPLPPIDAPGEPAGATALEKGQGRRPARTGVADQEPDLDIDLEAATSGSVAEGVLTSDGATRLLVTAYIGIGNRLFIRGSGPDLSWEKGMPLQFVSIGKWRWETNEASAPVRFRLYKNDVVECSALGEQAIDPGHQQEVTAAFG